MARKLTIMPCLDMINGRVVKGVNFVDIKDAGDPVECCRAYCAAGADELAMLDITATVEGRKTMLDVAQNAEMPSGYEVYIDGGRTATGADAIEWTKRVNDFGVACILPTSKSTDGVRTGYDLPLIRKIRAITEASVVASGGAGTMEHFAEAAEAGADVLLAASVFHFHVIGIPELKKFLAERGLPVRL